LHLFWNDSRKASLPSPGDVDYKEFLVPGIFAQTVVFGATFTDYGLADDMQKGIIDRFRSLTGLLVGWRIREGVVDALLGFVLLLVFAYAISWIMAYVGLIVPSVEVVNNASFIVIMPLTFVSNAFVPQESFSGPLQTFVEWNPVSTVTQACRELFGNTADGVPVPDSWAMQHPVA
jgi:ABC-type multidrug transport system permease subunit